MEREDNTTYKRSQEPIGKKRDAITGKRMINILNKKEVSKYELDEIFLEMD